MGNTLNGAADHGLPCCSIDSSSVKPQAAAATPSAPPAPAAGSAPSHWTVDEVYAWLLQQGFPVELAESFAANDIEGFELLELSADEITTGLGVTKVGHVKRITALIGQLREREQGMLAQPPPPASPDSGGSGGGGGAEGAAAPAAEAPRPAAAEAPNKQPKPQRTLGEMMAIASEFNSSAEALPLSPALTGASGAAAGTNSRKISEMMAIAESYNSVAAPATTVTSRYSNPPATVSAGGGGAEDFDVPSGDGTPPPRRADTGGASRHALAPAAGDGKGGGGELSIVEIMSIAGQFNQDHHQDHQQQQQQQPQQQEAEELPEHDGTPPPRNVTNGGQQKQERDGEDGEGSTRQPASGKWNVVGRGGQYEPEVTGTAVDLCSPIAIGVALS